MKATTMFLIYGRTIRNLLMEFGNLTEGVIRNFGAITQPRNIIYILFRSRQYGEMIQKKARSSNIQARNHHRLILRQLASCQLVIAKQRSKAIYLIPMRRFMPISVASAKSLAHQSWRIHLTKFFTWMKTRSYQPNLFSNTARFPFWMNGQKNRSTRR